MKFLPLLLISVTFNVTANILLKKGVIAIGGITGEKSKIILEFSKVASSPFIVSGLILYGFSFLVWLRVLSSYDLSKSYPIFATIVFMFTSVGSFIFLKEPISLLRLLGIAVMLLGIIIVART